MYHNINRAIIKKHQHSEGNEDIESHSYMYNTGNNPTTTYVEVSNRFESSTSGRFGNSNSRSKPKSRVYNTRYLRFGWTRRPPRDSEQHKRKYFQRRKGHISLGTDHHPQSANNQQAKIVRNQFKGFKTPSPSTHNPLTVAQPLDQADKISKKTTAKARSLPRLPVKVGLSVLTTKTSTTMKDFRTSEKSVDTQPLLLPQSQKTSGDSDQINHSGDQTISRKDQNLGDTCF